MSPLTTSPSRRCTPRNRRRDRLGFTLVELLMVIVIIGVLMALLLPAIGAALGKAREAGTSADINTIAQALGAFKAKFGDYPPSRVVLIESGDFSKVTSPASNLVPRSLAALRKFWPRMQISTSGTAPTILTQGFYDFNGDGVSQANNFYILTGPQCLVFFLGGLPQQVSTDASGIPTTWGVTGFAKDPTNPMQNSGKTSNRDTPMLEFSNGRLVTMQSVSSSATSLVYMPGYADTLGSFSSTQNPPLNPPVYAYFSAYSGVGYDPGDYDSGELDDSGVNPIVGAMMSINALTSSVYASHAGFVSSQAPNPYTSSPPVPTLATGHVDTSVTQPRTYINPNSFQIISPGRDRLFGIGGQYIQGSNSTATPLPFVLGGTGYTANSFQTQQANADVTGATMDAGIRIREMDNLTNFSTGRLQ